MKKNNLLLVLGLSALSLIGCAGTSVGTEVNSSNVNKIKKTVKEKCSSLDNKNYVFGGGECFRIKTSNVINNPKALIVLIHGDVSSGGASDYLAKRAYRTNPEANGFTVITLIRPGYYDSERNYSTGSAGNRKDQYTAHNIDAIASAIKNLKKSYKPNKVIVAGHSGGAAITGVIIGRHPLIVDGAVLAACPCDIPRWRRENSRSSWPNSLSPISYVDNIKNTKVVAIAGSYDKNTFPALMSDYIKKLKSKGIDGTFQLLKGVSHNGTARSDEFFSAIIGLAK